MSALRSAEEARLQQTAAELKRQQLKEKVQFSSKRALFLTKSASSLKQSGADAAKRRSDVRSKLFDALASSSAFFRPKQLLADLSGWQSLRALACVSKSANAYAHGEYALAWAAVQLQRCLRARRHVKYFRKRQREKKACALLLRVVKWRRWRRRMSLRTSQRRSFLIVNRDLPSAAYAFGELLGMQLFGAMPRAFVAADAAKALGEALRTAPRHCESAEVIGPFLAKSALHAFTASTDDMRACDTALAFLFALGAVSTQPRAVLTVLSSRENVCLLERAFEWSHRLRSVDAHQASDLAFAASRCARDMLRALLMDTHVLDSVLKEKALAAFVPNLVRRIAEALDAPAVKHAVAHCLLDALAVVVEAWSQGRSYCIAGGCVPALLKFLLRLTLSHAAALKAGLASPHADVTATLAAQVVWKLLDVVEGLDAAFEGDVCAVATAAIIACAAWPHAQALGCVLFGVLCEDRRRAHRMAPAVPLLEHALVNSVEPTVRHAAAAALSSACLRSDSAAAALAAMLTTQGIADALRHAQQPGREVFDEDDRHPTLFDARLLLRAHNIQASSQAPVGSRLGW